MLYDSTDLVFYFVSMSLSIFLALVVFFNYYRSIFGICTSILLVILSFVPVVNGLIAIVTAMAIVFTFVILLFYAMWV